MQAQAQQKQMVSILNEVNHKGPEVKLVKCLAVHNEEDWVEFNLANCYDEFDIIRVVEGAVKGRPGSTDTGHSTDRTLELVRNFPDPDNKIELYTSRRFFKSLEEQKQTFLDHANEGEWLFIIDCDEFYMEGEVNRVRKAITQRPTASEIIPTFLHFYRDFFHIKAPHPEWQPQHQRIIRYRKGLRYHTHPVATDAQGKCTYFTGEYQPQRFTMPGLWIYHYGHAKGKEFHEMKKEFYQSELEKFKLSDGTNASDKFDEKFVEFMDHTEAPDTILRFDGKHPKALETHPQMNEFEEHYIGWAKREVDVKSWKENFVYAAEALPTIALFMMGPWKRMQPLYNVIKV
jgi:hypothetical protein